MHVTEVEYKSRQGEEKVRVDKSRSHTKFQVTIRIEKIVGHSTIQEKMHPVTAITKHMG